MSNFNSNSNIGRVLLIILTVVICVSAVGGAVLGIINFVNKKNVPTINNTDIEYPSQWYGDESYSYRLISDTEMEICIKRVVTGAIQPNIKYYSTDGGNLHVVYVPANDVIQYKTTYSYSVKCEYTTETVNGRTVYNTKDVYFPSAEETPGIEIMYVMSGVYDTAPTQIEIREFIDCSAATASMNDHVIVNTKNFESYYMLQQQIHVILYDANYIAADEIILNN